MPAHEHPILGPYDPRRRVPRGRRRLGRGPQGRLRTRAHERPADPRGGCQPPRDARVRPQAIAALLPQVNANGPWYDTVDSNSTGTFVAPGVPLTPDVRNFDGDSESWNLAAPEHLQLGELGDAQARECRARPGRSRLPRGPAGPGYAHGRGLFQRARGARHARGRTSGARRDRPPARAVRKALRGRSHRRHGRAGCESRLRFRDRR